MTPIHLTRRLFIARSLAASTLPGMGLAAGKVGGRTLSIPSKEYDDPLYRQATRGLKKSYRLRVTETALAGWPMVNTTEFNH
jgi:hypothetical protein